jgi:hypothetical protein
MKESTAREPSAIDWFVDRLIEENCIDSKSEIYRVILLNAKNLEKQQIIDAFFIGSETPLFTSYTGNDYYNEIFKSE